jgi:hypothetical protein
MSLLENLAHARDVHERFRRRRRVARNLPTLREGNGIDPTAEAALSHRKTSFSSVAGRVSGTERFTSVSPPVPRFSKTPSKNE